MLSSTKPIVVRTVVIAAGLLALAAPAWAQSGVIVRTKDGAAVATERIRVQTSVGTAQVLFVNSFVEIDNQNALRLRELTTNGTNFVALRAPALLGSDVTLTLPPNAGGAGQFLQTDGAGTLIWASPPGAPVTSVEGATGAVDLASPLGSLAIANGGASIANLDVVFAGTGAANTAARSDHTHANGPGIGGPYVTSVTASGVMSSSGGTTPNITLSGIVPIANGGTATSSVPANGQLLIGNGAAYTVATLTAGAAISVTNGAGSITIANTGDTDPTNDITNTTVAGGDLSGTYPNPLVDGLQGTAVSATAPGAGQVLKFNGAAWAPGTDNDTTYSAGAGLSLAGTTFSLATPVSVANGGTGLSASGAAGNYLRSDGTNWASSAILAGDLPSGSTNYVQNQTVAAQAAGYWISGTGRLGGSLTLDNGTLTVGAAASSIFLKSNVNVNVDLDQDNNGSQEFAVRDSLLATALRVSEAGNVTTSGTDFQNTDGAGTLRLRSNASINLDLDVNADTVETLNVRSNVSTVFTINESGQVTLGTWQGTTVGAIYGGTGQSTVATGDLLYGSAVNTWSKLAAGAAGNVLTMSGGVPAWIAPSSGAPQGAAYVTVGNDATLTAERAITGGTAISIADGGANSTITINNTGVTSFNGSTGPVTGVSSYNGSTGVVTGVSTINAIAPAAGGNFTLTAGAGVTITPGVNSVTITNTGDTNPFDDVTAVTATAPLTSSGGTTPNISLTGIVGAANGGTGLNTSATATGSILYTSGIGTWTTLGPGGPGNVLTMSGGVPVWSAAGSGAPVGAAYVTIGNDATLTAERAITAGTAITFSDTGANGSLTINNAGVTSLAAGAGISVSGATGPVTVTNTGDTNPFDDITGSGTATQVGYFSGGQTLTSNSNLSWDTTNLRLTVNTATRVGQATTLPASGFNPGGTTWAGSYIENNVQSAPFESSGFWSNGDFAMIWSPGDNGLLRVYDEDLFGSGDAAALRFWIDGVGSAMPGQDLTQNLGSPTFRWSNSYLNNATVYGAATTAKINKVVVVDGVTYTTIQAAINALPATGGTVFIPEGTYTITSSLTLPVGNITLQGAGPGSIISASSASGISLIAVNQSNITITGLTLQFTALNTAATNYGINVTTGNRLTVKDCSITNCTRGINTASASVSLFYHLYTNNIFNNSGYALFLDNPPAFNDYFVVANNTIQTTANAGLYTQWGRWGEYNGNQFSGINAGFWTLYLALNQTNSIVTGNSVIANAFGISNNGTGNVVASNN